MDFQPLEFGQIIFTEGEHHFQILPQQIEFVERLGVRRELGFQRGRQAVFDEFAELLQQPFTARRFGRCLSAQGE